MSEYDSQLRLRADQGIAAAARHDRSVDRRRQRQRHPDQAASPAPTATPSATSCRRPSPPELYRRRNLARQARRRCWPPCRWKPTILNMLLFMIIAVAGFGILAIFYMIVVEKTRDIGILKSLGASGRGVMGIFLAYGLSLGLVGSGVGMVIGLLFVHYINQIADCLGWITGRPVFNPAIYYFYRIPTIVDPRRWPGSSPGRWGSPWWPAFCRPCVRPACIPWRPCAMSEVGNLDVVRRRRAGRLAPCRRHPAGGAPQLLAKGLKKNYRKGPVEVPVLRGVEPGRAAGRVPGDRRPERLRQEHAPAPAGHARRARRRRDPLRRPADRQPRRRPSATRCATAASA